MNKKVLLFSTSLLCLSFVSSKVEAGWKEGVIAYENQNYNLALTEFAPLTKTEDASYVLYYLGDMYENGLGVPIDYQKALAFYLNSVNLGDTRSAVKVGSMYYNGKGVPQNFKNAFAWFNYAAEKEDPTALYNMALMYMDGNSVPLDYHKGFAYMKKSASKGYVYAQKELGQMYYEGKGTPQDYTTAIKYLIMAANQGDVDSQMLLGDMLSNKDIKGVPISFVHAHKWYNIAAAYADEPLRSSAVAKRDALLSKMKPLEVKEAQELAASWKPLKTETIYFGEAKNTPNSLENKAVPNLGLEKDENTLSSALKKENKESKAVKNTSDAPSNIDKIIDKSVESWNNVKSSVKSFISDETKGNVVVPPVGAVNPSVGIDLKVEDKINKTTEKVLENQKTLETKTEALETKTVKKDEEIMRSLLSEEPPLILNKE